MVFRRGRAESDLEVAGSPKKTSKRTKEQIHNNEQTRKSRKRKRTSGVDAANLAFEQSRMKVEDLLSERRMVEQKFEKLKAAYEEATGRRLFITEASNLPTPRQVVPSTQQAREVVSEVVPTARCCRRVLCRRGEHGSSTRSGSMGTWRARSSATSSQFQRLLNSSRRDLGKSRGFLCSVLGAKADEEHS